MAVASGPVVVKWRAVATVFKVAVDTTRVPSSLDEAHRPFKRHTDRLIAWSAMWNPSALRLVIYDVIYDEHRRRERANTGYEYCNRHDLFTNSMLVGLDSTYVERGLQFFLDRGHVYTGATDDHLCITEDYHRMPHTPGVCDLYTDLLWWSGALEWVECAVDKLLDAMVEESANSVVDHVTAGLLADGVAAADIEPFTGR
eukprot:6078525-Prymnesium_polylepis.1